jgi:hypothetical protein
MPTPSLLIVPARFKTGKLYSQIPTSGAGDFTVTRNTTATRLNDAGVIESVASGIPRLDYSVSGFVTGCPALLVEPAATNSIRNNSNTNAVTGTTGTLPTNWSETSTAGLTRSIVALGTENGVAYIDIRYSGTANATAATLNFESTTQIVATSGQVWTNSAYLKSIAAPNPYATIRLGMVDRTSGGTFIVAGQSSDLTLTSTLTRFSLTRTLSSGSTVARVQPNVAFGLVSGTAYNFTVRIGYTQMELGSVATSVIPTTAGTGSRSADVISVSGAVSGSIGQTEGTIYAEVDVRNFTNSARVIALSDGTGANAINLQLLSPDRIRVTVNLSSSNQADFSAVMPAGVNKLALGYAQNNIALYLNGTSVGTDTSCNIPATNKVDLGSLNGGTILNDRIRAAALYTTRLTNAELATLTTP